ncbi:MAG: hypothetical protein HC767_06515 [Akkermansiaceae bacterium]|nr:hypothetical protein [Akkermansiaceae bacterium]
MQLMKVVPEEQKRLLLKCFWSSMIAVVATSEAGFPGAATLQAAWNKYQAAEDSPSMPDARSSDTGEVPCVEQISHHMTMNCVFA